MKNITDLKKLLFDDILIMNRKEENYKKELLFKIKKLDELISYIEKDVYTNINTSIFKENYKLIYPNKILPKINNSFDYKKILQVLKNDYNLKIQEYNNIYAHDFVHNKYLSSNIIDKLKKGTTLKTNEINYIENRLKKENIEEKDIVHILEQIKIHNIHSKEKNINYSKLYQIRDIINTGYEEIKLPEKKNDKLDATADNMVKSLNDSNKEETIKLLNTLDYLSKEDKDYLYLKMLSIYQDKMLKLQQMLGELEIYKDKEAVSIIKYEFFNITEKYNIIKELYEKNNKKQKEDNKKKTFEEYKFYYSTNSKENEKCYFIRDLEDIREESYETILKLLKDYKNGDNSKTKPLIDYDDTFEIKDDQIRIILKRMGGNNICVKGVFIKKDDNYRPAYKPITNRPTANIDDEYSMLVEDYLEKFVKENARKGTRK